MARKANTTAATTEERQLGSEGAPRSEEPEPITKSEVHLHHHPAPAAAHHAAPAAKAHAAAPPPPAKRFRVVGLHQPKQVLLNGVMALFRPGKEVDESNHDIGLLQRLGLQLEEIK